MDTVSHREMRNNSGEILRRVERGDTICVTNNGRVAAVLSPPGRSVLDDLIARGQARLARQAPTVLSSIKRRTPAMGTAEILADLRGDR